MGYDKDKYKMDGMSKGKKVSELQPGVEEQIKEGRKDLRKSINSNFSY